MMDERYLRILEYDKIIEQLAAHTSFSAGRELALALRPTDDEEEVRRRLQETNEAKALLAIHSEAGVGGARDVRPLARRAAIAGILRPAELLEIRQTLLSARSLRALLTRLAKDYPLLATTAEELAPLPEISTEIARCLDDEGHVLDAASPALAHIRRESHLARERLVERLRRLIGASENARFLQEPLITERNGRYVIPLKVEFKGRIPGIIHDQSASGATLFIEPLETVELNNRWHELQLEEQREIERILAELTRLVGQEAETIIRDVEVLAALDLALAKGRYSYALRGAPAMITPKRWPLAAPETPLEPGQHPLNLIRARHPLLPQETAVPINVYLGGNDTVLLITGPNTGGKTVSLKTVGLLAAMHQAGLHIPAADGSQLPVFSGIYADIGDEQSIEQNLSTFSSHMTHIVDILRRADAESLVLLDELGAGTDPVEGAALAQALVQTLLERGCLTICTTHYSQLKLFAFSTPGVENAAVEFDPETLSPTFNLVIGLPGRSNALAIARRLGLDEEIIARAEGLITPQDLQADALLAQVKRAHQAAEEARLQAEQTLAKAQALERELRQKLAEIEELRRETLNAAREEGRKELERLRAEIRRLRQGTLEQAPGAQTPRQALAALDRLAEEMAPLQPPTTPPPPEAQALQAGDVVYVSTLGQEGELLHIADQEAEVRIGGFRLRAPLASLAFRRRPQRMPRDQETTVGQPQVASPGMELDLRGRRAEEVAPALERYLDHAYLAGLPWVQIIHGKGTGVLKEVVRQFLAHHPLVASYRPGTLGEGGEGVTIAQFHPREGA
jgi:DNA mismatch repair protein MutS2